MPRLNIPIDPGTSSQNRQADVLDAIIAIDNELVEWILHAQPTNEAEKNEMKRVLALRTKLNQQLNEIVLVKMKLATAALAEQGHRLNAITAQVRATTKSISSAKEVLVTADEVVNIAAHVIAAIA